MNLDWMMDGACVGQDVDTFFPNATGTNLAKLQDAAFTATMICDTCPVREACLEHAIANREEGVWGGTLDYERARIRRDRNRGTKRCIGANGKCNRPLHDGLCSTHNWREFRDRREATA